MRFTISISKYTHNIISAVDITKNCGRNFLSKEHKLNKVRFFIFMQHQQINSFPFQLDKRRRNEKLVLFSISVSLYIVNIPYKITIEKKMVGIFFHLSLISLFSFLPLFSPLSFDWAIYFKWKSRRMHKKGEQGERGRETDMLLKMLAMKLDVHHTLIEQFAFFFFFFFLCEKFIERENENFIKVSPFTTLCNACCCCFFLFFILENIEMKNMRIVG